MKDDLFFMEAMAELSCSEGRNEGSDLVNAEDKLTTVGDKIRVSKKPTGGPSMWFQIASCFFVSHSHAQGC